MFVWRELRSRVNGALQRSGQGGRAPLDEESPESLHPDLFKGPLAKLKYGADVDEGRKGLENVAAGEKRDRLGWGA